MKYTLVMSRDAKRRMDEVAFYIADESGDIDTALRMVEKFDEAAQTLCEMPMRGIVPKQRILAERGYRMLIVEPYILFYQCDDKKRTVTVLDIVHAKRDYMNLLL